ncbi:MAG: ribosome biogenesis GTPase YlqF [Coprobacillus sp.]|nr:ribosome biogenesis GTPase YlqF [Coprobacillus sp.]CCY07140.1 ribosome biogenesis GTPase A [Coprobacillus sp. CAG:698]
MNIQWFPGHMAKARREIEEKLKVVDIALVLVDARIPISSQNPMAMEILKNKPQLMILTKSDMADNNMTKKWEKYFLNQGKKAISIDSISGLNVKKIETLAKEILKEKIERDLKRGMKMRPIRAIIVGIPNVGKSTLINKLAGKKVANVGNMPGVTKAQQWIRLNQNLELLDTPGVLWPKFDDKKIGIHLALTGAIKDEILPKEDLTFYLIDFLKENYPDLFEKRYNVSMNQDTVRIIEEVLQKRGNKKDEYEKGYDIILNDFKNARIGKITLDKI